jgi:polyisoprenoid-binding protein YceI
VAQGAHSIRRKEIKMRSKQGTKRNRMPAFAVAAAGLLLVPGLLFATRAVETDNASRLLLASQSRLWVDGTSTVRSYTCQAERIDVTVQLDPAAGGAEMASLNQAVKRVELTVPVTQLECGNTTMNSHMRTALKASEHQTIAFRMTRLNVVTTSAGQARTTLEGRLRIAGQDRPATLTGELVEAPDGSLRLRGSHEFPMSQFGVAPPRLMAGTLRVHDPVKVQYDLILRPAN